MDSLSGIVAFVHVAETRSFTEAGRILEVSSSAIGKSVARVEERLGVRLFHRSTRSVTLTSEGELFLERCKRIIDELDAAQLELSQLSAAPRGKLRISMPLQNTLILPVLAAFTRAYPEIELDVDLSDRMVDVIEEGFDAVVRTGEPMDSRLMSRKLGNYKLQLVASPDYLMRQGTPTHPDELRDHSCLLHRFPASGLIERWPVRVADSMAGPELSRTITCTTTDALNYLALDGIGIACLPDFSIKQSIKEGKLTVLLDEFNDFNGTLWMLWPSNRHASPKLRALIDFFRDHMLA
ncbi:LysR substrate-binding domain-containing protein [Pseudomonas sp. NA-150]|uniref:LysR substrate-binding domain-containing protein n=1 Tax=Pseudomonas sp. NA-150 TaxID=3367525 RepID=UPI0037C8C884